jgi:hypothetical protein
MDRDLLHMSQLSSHLTLDRSNGQLLKQYCAVVGYNCCTKGSEKGKRLMPGPLFITMRIPFPISFSTSAHPHKTANLCHSFIPL